MLNLKYIKIDIKISDPSLKLTLIYCQVLKRVNTGMDGSTEEKGTK